MPETECYVATKTGYGFNITPNPYKINLCQVAQSGTRCVLHNKYDLEFVGFNTIQSIISSPGSDVPIHAEDAHFDFFNELIEGCKLWKIWPPKYYDKITEYLNKFENNNCI